MSANLLPATLIESFMLTPKVKHFILDIDASVAFNYLPGQFITIHFEYNGTLLKRSYSIANPPKKNNRIEFAAGYVDNGPGSDYLFNLSPGDIITITGPFGRLIFKDNVPKRYILVATSTGITPYRAMLDELHQRLSDNSHLNVLIMLGVQNTEDALYADEFSRFCAAHPTQASFRLQLSRSDGLNLAPGHHKGYVQHAFADIALNPAEDVVYLCGNPSMIDSAFEDLKAQGFTMPQIIREKYISAR